MFFDKYLDDFYLEELFQNYDINYLKNIDKNNFDKVYQLLKKYHFDYIEDIILGYLDIFTMDCDVIEKRILSLKKILGSNYVDKIGENMFYLEYIANERSF